MKWPESLLKALTAIRQWAARTLIPSKVVSFFTRNMLTKLIALGFAMIIWIYVLVGTNPVAEKIITDVPVTIDGEAQLSTRALALTQSPDSYVNTVDVRVKARYRDILNLSEQSIVASLNFSQITRTGEQKAEITARLKGISSGEVLEIKPNSVDVVVENRVTKQVPMKVKLVGQLRSDLWNGEPQSEIQEVVIMGPTSQVESVAYAQITIDLSKITTDVQSTWPFAFYNNADKELKYDQVTTNYNNSVRVNMKVYPQKEVPVEIDLIGQLPEGLEFESVTAVPDKVKVVAPQSELDELETVKISVQVAGITEDYVEERAIVGSVDWIKVTPDVVEVRMLVQEKSASHTFTVPVDIEGEDADYDYIIDPHMVDVDITGVLSKLNGLSASDFTVFLNVSGLLPGSHEVVPKLINPPVGIDAEILQKTIIVEIEERE